MIFDERTSTFKHECMDFGHLFHMITTCSTAFVCPTYQSPVVLFLLVGLLAGQPGLKTQHTL
jgi:hypothetical protein